jgi:hypothetical protein
MLVFAWNISKNTQETGELIDFQRWNWASRIARILRRE